MAKVSNEAPPATTHAQASAITIPSKSIRSVTIGVLVAVIFASVGVGFAVGRVTAPVSAFGSSSTGGFGFPRPGGGLRGPGTQQGGNQQGGNQQGGQGGSAPAAP